MPLCEIMTMRQHMYFNIGRHILRASVLGSIVRTKAILRASEVEIHSLEGRSSERRGTGQNGQQGLFSTSNLDGLVSRETQ